MSKDLKILAVGDPAVDVYVDPRCSIISKFEDNTGIAVSFDIVPWVDYYGTMMEAFVGNRDYDIVMIAGHLWSRDFVDKGFIAEVYYPSDNKYDRDDILPVVMDEMMIGDKTYLFPSFCDGHMILYRKSVVDLLGRPFNKVVTTDELISAVNELHGKQEMDGIALKAHPSEILLDILPYLRSEGVEVFDYLTHKPSFNNSKGLKGLEKYLSLREFAPKDTAGYGNDEVWHMFQKRKVVFAVTWGGQLGTVMDDRCEEPWDVGFSTLNTPWNVTWSFAVNARSKRQQDANTFLVYITGKEIDRIVGGYAGSPIRKSTYEIDGHKYPWYPIHLEMIKDFAKPLPKMYNAGAKMGPLYTHLAEAFQNKKTPIEALSDAEADILKIDEEDGLL